ncbi:hypothetical protein CABS01_10319 [Colletotrichum abscissum]|uniref:uncharacterized protein n=1 Tax=Colletotrichum abscissum TaxID=1671311 RepID=UPI0027D660BA|nr:uncharacterized protein CABS01_10319 [Colletotrichum abscissum]KAK1499921.1 hypothetical protein CABS01_10319 [Colletotrichum abscissum]
MSTPRGRPRRNVPPCRFCQKQFRRFEHLERHERTRKPDPNLPLYTTYPHVLTLGSTPENNPSCANVVGDFLEGIYFQDISEYLMPTESLQAQMTCLLR